MTQKKIRNWKLNCFISKFSKDKDAVVIMPIYISKIETYNNLQNVLNNALN